MPLEDIELPLDGSSLPHNVTLFLREANLRIHQFYEENPGQSVGFIPSDFHLVYQALKGIAKAGLAPGNAFCEWGSAFGVIAGMAAMIGFDAYGIESEKNLVEEAHKLTAEFEIPVELVHGSFLPYGWEDSSLDSVDIFAWLDTDAASAYDELGLDIRDFDLIFIYPWPDEEQVILDIFEEKAAAGALLLMNSASDSLRLRRK